MAALMRNFTKEELDEVFPHAAVREVSFEIRFPPRLRINAELWKLQDRLVEQYPDVSTESVFVQPGGPLSLSVFQNPGTGRCIKVSQENFIVAFTKYPRFEDFKDEVSHKTAVFCETFGVASLIRVGLRYVNNVELPPGASTGLLLKYVRPLTDFDRAGVENVDQFLNEVRLRHSQHLVTLRGVFLPPLQDGRRIYVLDIDCHSFAQHAQEDIGALLDRYHDSAQEFFLDHITEEYKNVMRGKS
jgi:uncharacterized protein (TIGR04255 family)